MPLSRYEIRNEYSLADQELYKSADRDDPEALLEGVAMAGLVGVLRQLGDLAEFAAEVFHNLHEEVMATAERGHSLKARVQQLEVEFPLIEKLYLSQTNHSDFFYTAGVDWHPNMHIDQNYITRGDLPRFIMDSYEEARGPPQLFLLDKFDVAGAGACLKRFTDPSFFKVEAAALGITNADVQRDKVRKWKRRGSRWRNGETPEVLPTPHAKLHELLLEDRIENTASNPARLVKLKRRLNGFPFDLKTGKSYMEKILRTPPVYRELHEVHNSSPLKLLDNDSMPELEMNYFGSESPDVELTNRNPIMSPDLKTDSSMREMEFEMSNESSHFRPELEREEIGLKSSDLQSTHRSPSLTPDMRASVPNISMDEQEFEALEIERKDFPEGKNNLEVGNIISTVYEDVVEKQIVVDKESKSEASSVYQSDDVASEVENYMDALAAMESEMETDSELRAKSNLHVLSNKKLIAGLDAATPLRQAHFSDSQSMGSSTLSDDGNSSSKKYSNSSYSGSPHILTKKALLEDEVSDEIDSSNENGEAKRISRPLKWRGRTRSAGGNKVAAIPPYKTDDVEQSISITDISPGFMVNRDADASEGGNGVLPLKLGGMLYAEGVPIAAPSNSTENESNVSLNVSSDSTSSSIPQKTEYDYSVQVVAENYSSSNGDDSHLTGSSSSNPITYDDTCFTGEFKDQHMEVSVDKNMYLLQDVTPVSCSLDGGPLSFEEDLSSSHKYQPFSESANDNPRMPEHPTNPSPLKQSENGLLEGLPNDESGRREVIGVFNIAYVHPSSCKDDTAEEKMSRSSVESMPQRGDGKLDFYACPVNQIDPPIITMSSAEEQTKEPRSPELETDNREIDAESTDDSLVREVSPPKEVTVEEVPTFSFQRDLCSENFHISGMTDTLQPLDPVNRSINNQIEEQFPDTSLSETEYCSDGADHNVIIPGGSTMALPGGEIAVNMEDQALSGIPKGGNTKDIQAPVVLDSVPRPDVETSDNEDEILHELPGLAVRVVTDVASAGETGLFTESLSVTADDMMLLNAAKVETSSYQMENLHELSGLVGQELGGVASSTDLGERGTTHCELSAESVNLTDADVDGGRIESNLYGVDVEVPFSVTYGELETEEKENLQKAASQPFDDDHSDSRIIDKISNSHSEFESSLQTDITASLTFEQNGSQMNGVLAEKNTLDADSVDTEKKVYTQDASPMSIYHVVEEQKVETSLQQLDNGKNQVSTVAGESNVVVEPQLTQKTNSGYLDQEAFSGIASISFSRNLPGQHSGLELFPQEKPTIDDVRQHNKPLGSISPVFGLLPETVNTDSVEMPPLPPLPPVQWRMGRKQQDSLAHELAVLPNNNILFPSMAPSLADLNAQTPKLIIPSHANEAEHSLLICESISDTPDQDHPSSLQVPLPVNNTNITHLQALGEMQPVDQNLPFPGSDSNLLSLRELESLNNNLPLPETSPDLAAASNSKFPSLSETQSMPQYLSLPAKHDEMPRPDDHTSTSSNASSSGSNGNEAAACDVELVVDSATLSNFNEAQETNQNKILDQGSSSSESNASIHDASALLTGIDSERPHNMMLSLEGEVAWPAQDEGKPYGVRPMKPPRQRNPLIDAVIALDRSKFRKVAEQHKTYIQKADERDSLLENLQLRKVTEQPRTQILKADEKDSVLENLQLRKVTEQPKTHIQKADKRDSLLAQIRAKTVNLKPTVVSRPAVQGPSTNLKVAAILEKAKTIRQAFAGSDDDDDDDSWSDS